MAKVVKRTFSLTEEQAKFIDRKVDEGQFASGSEVVRQGIRAVQERDVAIERWLREEVVPIYDRVMAGEEKLLTPEDVRRGLQRKYQKLAKAAE
ncbi:MAG TPA: type II toxin-antitoxin system ParD family antitoxin [Devosia sp.]|nr:type II toxin-antitoxin system ParD family antitoxin [Devosia sp.]